MQLFVLCGSCLRKLVELFLWVMFTQNDYDASSFLGWGIVARSNTESPERGECPGRGMRVVTEAGSHVGSSPQSHSK